MRNIALQKDDELLPGKKGIMLSPAEWSSLASSLPTLSKALEEGSTDEQVELSGTRKAVISDYKKGELSVDVREWYEKDGELKPGAKGIMLSGAAFSVRSWCRSNHASACVWPGKKRSVKLLIKRLSTFPNCMATSAPYTCRAA
jgi:hypothetical protein